MRAVLLSVPASFSQLASPTSIGPLRVRFRSLQVIIPPDIKSQPLIQNDPAKLHRPATRLHPDFTCALRHTPVPLRDDLPFCPVHRRTQQSRPHRSSPFSSPFDDYCDPVTVSGCIRTIRMSRS